MEASDRVPRHRTACDSCKRMKIKCTWDHEAPKCRRCGEREVDCTVTIKERKKREKKKYGDFPATEPNILTDLYRGNHITTLEDRLKRMESVITSSGLSLDSSGRERLSSDDIAGQAGMVDKFSSLNISATGDEEFVGASSGFSIFSPQGLRLITSITGNDEFAQFMVGSNYYSRVRLRISPSLWYPISEQERRPLPSREVADPILKFLFDRLIPSFPIFNRKQFMERYERQYPVKCSDDPAWYACLNVCFAIAAIIRKEDLPGMSPQSASSPKPGKLEHLHWWKWLRNAASTFVDLQLGQPSLTAVQAMAGLVGSVHIFFKGKTLPDPYPCSVMAAATLRLAQAIGLHRNLSDSGLDEDEIEQRRNIFWIAIMIERGIVTRTGRPSIIHEEDIGVDLPPEGKYPENIDGRFVTFRHNATLALLQGRIYNRLYSAKSLTKSKSERLKMVGVLDEELQQWRESVPIEVRPGHKLKCDTTHMVTVVAMHWLFWQCVMTVHRVSLYYGPGAVSNDTDTSHGEFDPTLNPRVYASAAICVYAARSTIQLLDDCMQLSSPLETNVLRMSDYYPLSACLILFSNLLQHPLDPQAQSDLRLMNKVTSFLSSFSDDQASEDLNPIIPIFLEINRVAADYVVKARKKPSKNSKRSRGESFNTAESSSGSDESSDELYESIEPRSRAASGHLQSASISPPVSLATQPSSLAPGPPPDLSVSSKYDASHYQHQDNTAPVSQLREIPSSSQPHPSIWDMSYSSQTPHTHHQQNHLPPTTLPSQMSPADYHTTQVDSHAQARPDSQQFPSSSYMNYSGSLYPSPDQNQHPQLPYPPRTAAHDTGGRPEASMVPQENTWFFPMISPWYFGADPSGNQWEQPSHGDGNAGWSGG
ncbi:fungal specific transcription factor domain protein [Rutstroemia sp. NJR-2017a BBW]|nr:fungal specific transcription factor domain protein [Rutstroemia sp. NJR-2017a BBW]